MKTIVIALSILACSSAFAEEHLTRSEREALEDVQVGRGIVSAKDPPNHQLTFHESVRKNGSLRTRRSIVINRDNRYNLTPTERWRFNNRRNIPPNTIIIHERRE